MYLSSPWPSPVSWAARSSANGRTNNARPCARHCATTARWSIWKTSTTRSSCSSRTKWPHRSRTTTRSTSPSPRCPACRTRLTWWWSPPSWTNSTPMRTTCVISTPTPIWWPRACCRPTWIWRRSGPSTAASHRRSMRPTPRHGTSSTPCSPRTPTIRRSAAWRPNAPRTCSTGPSPRSTSSVRPRLRPIRYFSRNSRATTMRIARCSTVNSSGDSPSDSPSTSTETSGEDSIRMRLPRSRSTWRMR